MSQRKRDRKSRELPRVHPAAAAIDIGATMHVAAVGPDRDQNPSGRSGLSPKTFIVWRTGSPSAG